MSGMAMDVTYLYYIILYCSYVLDYILLLALYYLWSTEPVAVGVIKHAS
jgi:hypothetical protein